VGFSPVGFLGLWSSTVVLDLLARTLWDVVETAYNRSAPAARGLGERAQRAEGLREERGPGCVCGLVILGPVEGATC
jgi:hypothetical protein